MSLKAYVTFAIQKSSTMRLVLLLTFTLLFTGSVYCQDDGPWWKRLFRKETIENQDKNDNTNNPEKPSKQYPPLIEHDIEQDHIAIDSLLMVPEILRPGKVVLKTDPKLALLDSMYKDQPPKILGYRIKIYFGGLEQARGIRVNYISSGNKDGCYLKQYPPNFAVMVGNFRSQTEAYQRLNELKALYPGASIVRDEIELSQLD